MPAKTISQLTQATTINGTDDFAIEQGGVTKRVAASVVRGDIANANVSATAAIAHSKLASIPSGQVLLGNASNVPTATALTGDVTVSSTGVTTISAGSVITADIADAAVTAPKLSGAQTGSAPIYGVRAWVNFDGTATNNLTGTYSQSGTTVTVTATAHGHIVGNRIYVDITSGTGVDGWYTITSVPNSNSFTYTAGTSLTTSGNFTLLRRNIRASGNINSVAYTPTQAATYAVNFSTAMPDGSYATNITSSTLSTSGQGGNALITDQQTGRVEVIVYNISTGSVATDPSTVCLSILR